MNHLVTNIQYQYQNHPEKRKHIEKGVASSSTSECEFKYKHKIFDIELLVLTIISCLKHCRILNCQLQRSIAGYERTSRFCFDILCLWLCLQFLACLTVPFKDTWINYFYFRTSSFTMINTSTVQTKKI